MLQKTALAKWHKMIATDVAACFNICRIVLGAMRERDFGRIVDISSFNGRKGKLGRGKLRRRHGRHPRPYQGDGARYGIEPRCGQGD
jgi:NAD(P)-dependent dehydrogenase (short-subunit alcohol dehydrogenase family)